MLKWGDYQMSKKKIVLKLLAFVTLVGCACGVGAANKVKKLKERRQIKFGFSAIK